MSTKKASTSSRAKSAAGDNGDSGVSMKKWLDSSSSKLRSSPRNISGVDEPKVALIEDDNRNKRKTINTGDKQGPHDQRNNNPSDTKRSRVSSLKPKLTLEDIAAAGQSADPKTAGAVSYTHLTLPTIYSV